MHIPTGHALISKLFSFLLQEVFTYFEVIFETFLFHFSEESVFSVPGVKLWPEERRFSSAMLKAGHEFRKKAAAAATNSNTTTTAATSNGN